MRSIRLRLLAVLALATGACGGDPAASADAALIRPVTRGDLLITVRERGEIRAARDTRIISELEGRATLIELIKEGTILTGGEVLAKLDVSAIEERRAQQAIAVAKAQAALEQARKAVEIVEKELKAAERTAETRLAIARLRLQKFIGQARQTAGTHTASAEESDGAGTNARMLEALRQLAADDPDVGRGLGDRLAARVSAILGGQANLDLEMGDMAVQVLQQIDAIGLARSDLKLAERTASFSQQLFDKGFYTLNELEQDQIDLQRRQAAHAVAWNSLLLLVNYTLPETLLTLELEAENSQLNLESVRAAGEARRVREDAELASIEAEFALATEQLANWELQLQRGVLIAPGPGLVVYGRMDWDEPVYEGMEVRERQEIIILPDITSMVADIKVPESQIGRLAVGQRATLQLDAFPSRLMTGVVTDVASLPDPAPRSQVAKVYVASVLIDGANEGGALRPGMSGAVTIEVGTVSGVLLAPITALERQGDEHFVWLETAGGPVPAPVQLGASNLTHVEVLEGLAEGDRIHLVRPPGVRLPDAAAGDAPPEEASEPAS